MVKQVYETVDDIPKEGEKPKPEAPKEPEKEPCKKKKKVVPDAPPINPATGRPYPPGPPGSTHG